MWTYLLGDIRSACLRMNDSIGIYFWHIPVAIAWKMNFEMNISGTTVPLQIVCNTVVMGIWRNGHI